MSESTVSATVKLQGENGADILFTVRAGVTLDEACVVLDTLAGAMRYAREKYKLTPTPARSNGQASTNGNGAGGPAPVCEFHGAMKRSKKFDGWYCPSKMGDGSYCKRKVEG